MLLDEAARTRVATAVANAEAETSGEIVCIVERALEPHWATAWLLGAVGALTLPTAFLAAQSLWAADWEASHLAPSTPFILVELVGLQGLAFGALYALAAIPAVRRMIEPAAVRRRRVHDAAMRHFVSRGVHQTRDRTGILLFVVEQEKWAEIVADEGIHAKVGSDVWVDAIQALVAGVKRDDVVGGFEAAIGRCAEVLTEHFPRRPDDVDELSNRLVVLD
ncbi:MAG: TPM domain-containing protein [Myxococcota bacterium]